MESVGATVSISSTARRTASLPPATSSKWSSLRFSDSRSTFSMTYPPLSQPTTPPATPRSCCEIVWSTPGYKVIVHRLPAVRQPSIVVLRVESIVKAVCTTFWGVFQCNLSKAQTGHLRCRVIKYQHRKHETEPRTAEPMSRMVLEAEQLAEAAVHSSGRTPERSDRRYSCRRSADQSLDSSRPRTSLSDAVPPHGLANRARTAAELRVLPSCRITRAISG